MKKFLTFLLSFCILFNLFITPAVAETSSSASTEKQYYKFIADDTGNIYPILISEQEFQKAVGIRSPHYAEGWIVTSISGNTVAYISLHYQTCLLYTSFYRLHRLNSICSSRHQRVGTLQ